MIIWFSGTGNSRAVSMQLWELLRQSMERITPELSGQTLTIPEDEKMMIWVCPVYSWGIPPFVRKIVRELKGGALDRLVHHLVLTCGDDCGRAPEMWRRDLRRRGWTAGNIYTVIMPNNYVAMKGFDVDSEEVAARKLEQAHTRVAEIAEELKAADVGMSSADGNSRWTTDVVRGSFAWLKTNVVYPWFVRHAMSPKAFHVSSDCISCGECVRICPLSNIVLSSDFMRPEWGMNCAGCLACYHICPRHAVAYGDATAGKGQYYLNPFALLSF